MLRNKEIRQYLVATGAATLLIVIISSFFVSYNAVVLIIVSSVLIVSISYYYKIQRYKEIEMLSGYLRQISAGDYGLDVRDNYEGELSILKNNIYKVTVMLAEHNELLHRDKLKLQDAISDISHQLKTPLTSMMMMIDLMSEPQLPENKRKEFTNHVQIQLERIEWLLSSLLKMAKIDAGTAGLKNEEVHMHMVVRKALNSLAVPIELKEIELIIAGDEDVTFTGDLNWTAEAVLNILKNNVEHVPHGGKLEIAYSENTLFTQLMLIDNGMGIPKDELPYLFQRFFKGKHASDGSTGIGLAMAHSIITNQRGVIEVQSKEGEGTVFTIKFYKQDAI